jgi:hypothetical protein
MFLKYVAGGGKRSAAPDIRGANVRGATANAAQRALSWAWPLMIHQHGNESLDQSIEFEIKP